MNAPAGYRQASPVLGNLLHTYGGRVPRRLLVLVWLCTPVILALTAGLTYLLVAQTDGAEVGDLGVAIGMDVFFAALTITLPAMALWHRARIVRVYEQGLEDMRRGKTVTIRWREIQRVFFTHVHMRVNGISTGPQATCRLEGDAFGSVRFIHWFDGVAELGQEIQRRIHPRLREEAWATWNRGEPVSFGPLTLTREGIVSKRRQIAWRAIEAVSIDGGEVRVRARGKYLPWSLHMRSKIPNALVLRELADHALQDARRSS